MPQIGLSELVGTFHINLHFLRYFPCEIWAKQFFIEIAKTNSLQFGKHFTTAVVAVLNYHVQLSDYVYGRFPVSEVKMVKPLSTE